jgi:hypothetical protein
VQRARLVQREHAPNLRLDVAVHLVEFDPGHGCAVRERREPPRNRSERRGDDDLPLGAGQTGRFGREVAASCGEQLAAVRGQLNRACAVDNAARTELVADRADDRDGELGDAADLPDRDWLELRSGTNDVADACVTLGQADGRGDLVDDPARLRHRRPRATIEMLVRVAPSRSLTTRRANSPSTSP